MVFLSLERFKNSFRPLDKNRDHMKNYRVKERAREKEMKSMMIKKCYLRCGRQQDNFVLY